MSGVDRRALLTLGATASLWAPGALRASTADTLRGMLVINALGGLDDPNRELTSDNPMDTATPTDAPDLDARVFQDLKTAGMTAVNITLGYVSGPQDPVEYTFKSIEGWQKALSSHAEALVLVRTADDILKAKAEGKTGVIFGFQNAMQVADKPERVDKFGELGVRVIQLTYNPRNPLGDGSMVAANMGLTAIGREVVERLNARRLMVDLSHSGERTCLDAIGGVDGADLDQSHRLPRALRPAAQQDRRRVARRRRPRRVRRHLLHPFFEGSTAIPRPPTSSPTSNTPCRSAARTTSGSAPMVRSAGIDDLEAYKGAAGASEVDGAPEGRRRRTRASGPTPIRSWSICAAKASSDGSPTCCALAAIARPGSKRSWVGTSWDLRARSGEADFELSTSGR